MSKIGMSSWEYQKEWKAKNPEKWKKIIKRRGVSRRLKAQKRLLILKNEKGGKCQMCGYDKEITILEFHHFKDKNFSISNDVYFRKLEVIREETKKCILLCPNCHAIIHIKDKGLKHY